MVVPFHRAHEFLRPAIASILGQTWRDLELVLVDNGTGLSADALGDLGRDPRLRWVRLPRNEGIEAGCNAGIAAAGGEFVALADSDDISLPNRFEQQLELLHRDPGLGVVSSLARFMDEQGCLGARTMFTLRRDQECRAYSLFDAPLVTGVAMGRRALLSEIGFAEDFPFAGHIDLWARVAERSRMAVLPETHLHYRWYSTQTTQTKFDIVERHRCAIQLITARRRAGRPENKSDALRLVTDTDVATAWRHVAAQSLREGFNVLAAYQARRSFVFDRTPGSALKAARLAFAAWRGAPRGERALTLAMFLTGPVRALKLHPA